ncbi:MAG: RpiB/LacA/LacB family sugar-phosphate isomerase [Acidobacteriota bacterium]
MIDFSEKQVITEHDLKEVAAGEKIQLAENAIITPLAHDLITARQLEIVRRRRRTARKRAIAIAADHGGYEMKEELKKLLGELGVDYHDFGTYDTKPVDYPDYAYMVAQAVSQAEFPLGIIIDGAGIGSCMVANKLPGVRAALAYTPALARNSREHNDANVLTLGGRFITAEAMREIVKTWLETSISEERHINRVAKIITIEKRYLR